MATDEEFRVDAATAAALSELEEKFLLHLRNNIKMASKTFSGHYFTSLQADLNTEINPKKPIPSAMLS